MMEPAEGSAARRPCSTWNMVTGTGGSNARFLREAETGAEERIAES